MVRLLTLVHISDLHIGALENPGLDAITKAAWERYPFLDGLLGHDGNALIRTEAFFHELASEEDAKLVITGDLTSMGRDVEFANAEKFLTSGLTWGDALALGLNQSNWKERAIAGNHDHWPGSGRLPMLGGPGKGLRTTFGAATPISDWSASLPWPGQTQPLRVRFLGIHTDADVRPHGINRFLARGSFRSELTKLRGNGTLSPGGAHEVRILLMHHSPSWSGMTLGIAKSSRAALEQFLGAEGFTIVLTGHTHRPLVRKLPFQYRGRPVDVWEACCGTTTQRIDPPYEWGARARAARSAGSQLNSLLVHRFHEEKGKLVWHVQGFGLRRRGWELCAFAPRHQKIDQRHQIWP
jgi:3',5'-cyclic AMP phosphodiesterase CpdA